MQVPDCHFVLTTGGRVVHSYGRLIPHEYPITDLQQISGPDGIGRINCSVSSGTARFIANSATLEVGGVSQTRNEAIATLVVNPSNVDSFQNRQLYCTDINTNFFYLFTSSASKLASMGCKHMCCFIPALSELLARNIVIELYLLQATHGLTPFSLQKRPNCRARTYSITVYG